MSKLTTSASIHASPAGSQPLLEGVKNVLRIALDTLTNVAGAEIDFPAVSAVRKAA